MESTQRPVLARAASARLPLLLALTAGGFVAQRVTQTVLDSFYARSAYPVPYYEGQLSFSASKLEGWYGTMQQDGTLGVYWQTQLVDFAFIAATAVFFTALLLCVARAVPSTHPARRIALALVPLGAAAASLDVVENLVSFVMLADPTSISAPVALLYSGVAALKFAGFLGVYAWTVVGLVLAVGVRVRRRRRVPAPVTA
ncbi:hypothetical protein [Cellulomonas sp. P5_C5]